jgi:hypothetical protein
MEVIRPDVDEFVLDWVKRGPLPRNHFFEQRDGNCRLMASFASTLSQTASKWAHLVAPVAEWFARIISTAKSEPQFVDLLFPELEWSRDEEKRSRDSLFQLASTVAKRVEGKAVGDTMSVLFPMEVPGIQATLVINTSDRKTILTGLGSLEILSAGIYVCDAPATEWLAPPLDFLSGRLDLAPKVVDLAAARNGVRDNHQWEAVKSALAMKIPFITADHAF